MNSKRGSNRRFVSIVLGGGGVLIAAGLVAYAAGVVVNYTPSAPRGLWRVETLVGPVARGQMVSLCPPDEAMFRLARERGYVSAHGRCPGDYEPMLKKVVAIPGDTVAVAPEGVSVNGRLLTNSAPLLRDGADRELTAMPQGTYTVADGAVWLVSSYTPTSFDSRYFGPVARAQIESAAQPLWTESHLSQSDISNLPPSKRSTTHHDN